MFRPLVILAGAGVASFCVSGQSQPRLTARELFYTPVPQAAAPAAAPAPQVKPAPDPKPARRASAQPVKQAPPAPVVATPEPASRPVQVPLVNASTASLRPLAIRYSLLKRADDDTYREVDADTVFRSGDKLRVSVQGNDSGYLYIVQRGSSKAWNVLFPSTEIDSGDNHIERNRAYTIPANARFTFDEQPGTERLFVVFSRRPVQDLEKLIYDLSGREIKPASGEPVAERPKPMMIAQNLRPVDDAFIDRLRSQVQARDLVFEKVDEKTPGERKEKAVYVATPDRAGSARVIAEIALKHE